MSCLRNTQVRFLHVVTRAQAKKQNDGLYLTLFCVQLVELRKLQKPSPVMVIREFIVSDPVMFTVTREKLL